MRVLVLGPLTVEVNGQSLSLGGRQQRLVFALLVAADGRAVSTGTLIDGVWGEDVTATARKALQGYVHHLRAEVGDALKTESGGYALETDGDVDAGRFATMHRQANGLLGVDPAQASELLREALGLWSGPAYGDLRDELALIPEVARLDNLRIAALGDRVDADLAVGRHEGLIGELEGLTYEYAFQERFRAQHMTALYRAGRQVDALRSYERMRRFLADETGLEPSAELQQLEQRILVQDESLLGDGNAAVTGPAAVRGYELRELVSSSSTSDTYRAYQRSIGRQVAVRVLAPTIADDAEFIATYLTDTARVAALEHPHISFVFDTWRDPGHAYQVSRWLGGGSLADALQSRPFGLAAGLRALDQIGGALAHAHRQGVVHGRIGPSKVLFDESGHAYLSDFIVGQQSLTGSAAEDRMDFAALAHRMIVGRPPEVVDGSLRPDFAGAEVPAAMASAFAVAFAPAPEGYERVDDFLRALRQAAGVDVVPAATGLPPQIDMRNPYKGLQPFQESDAGDFYGREDLVDHVAERLERCRLIAVVGPSGSGKSSILKAGLLPRLRSASNAPLLVTEMYPGAFPFEELESALLGVGVDRMGVLDDLLGDDRGLLRVIKQILPSDEAELILVIDQFEELFSVVSDEGARQLFLDSLVNAVSDPRSRLRVVVTMRADFFDRPLEYPRFGDLMKEGLVPVTVPSDEELARAVSQPARSVGVEFEPGLVAQIVHDVSGQPGGLPLMEYALTELFDHRDSDVLTLAAYQRSGSVHGALGRRAEELYQGLSPSAREAALQAFLRMVTVDESADDLRRRVRRSELSAPGVDEQALDEAIQTFGAHRLLTFDRDPVTRGPTVEVAHEALLREWTRLGDWVEEQRDGLVIRKRLIAALVEWQQSGKDTSYLPREGRLAQFEDWASTTTLSLTAEEREFLSAAEQQEADAAARAAARRRVVTIGLAAVAGVMAILAAVALVQNRNAGTQTEAAQESERLAREQTQVAEEQAAIAQQQSRRSSAQALAAAASNELNQDVDRALLLALAAAYSTASAGERVLPEAVGALHQSIGSHRIATRIKADSGSGLAWSPDGSLVLTAPVPEVSAAATIWEAETGAVVASLETTSPATGAAWGPDSLIATTHESGEIVLWGTDPLRQIASWQGEHGLVWPTFHPDGRLLAVGTSERVVVWDIEDRSEVWSVSIADPWHMDFSPDGRLLAIVQWDDDSVSVWDTTKGERVALLGLQDGPEDVAFDPTGSLLATLDGTVVTLWDVDTWTAVRSWPSQKWPRTVAWSPDGELIALSGNSRLIDVYDATTGVRQMELAGHTDATIRQLAFSGGSSRMRLASIDDSGVTLVWDLDPPSLLAARAVTTGSYRSTRYLTDESMGLVGSGDGVMTVDLLRNRVVSRLEEPISGDFNSYTVDTNGDGSIAVASREGGPVVVFDPVTMEALHTYPSVEAYGLSTDASKAIVDAWEGGEPRVIDLDTGDVVARLDDPERPDDDFWRASFSPDGSLVAVASAFKNHRVYSLTTNSLLVRLPVTAADPDTDANTTAFSSDGELLALGDGAGNVKIIAVEPLVAGAPESEWLLVEFRAFTGTPLSIQFHPDGSLLAVAGNDDIINFWSTDDWTLAFALDTPGPSTSIDFNDDGTELMTSVGDDGMLLVTVDVDILLERARDRVTRGFTEDECRIFNIEPCPTTLAAVREIYVG